ncbi:MAG: nucleotidyl transferase AbiEii/AbiGii toxin family protein [Candidatus Nanoarchaeia archaeon]|jgi:hypothetical protein
MISRKELEEYAKNRGLKNIGQAEKDYFQNIILFIIYQNYGTEIIFKGGTALVKCYGLNRFSEDLDFNCEEKFDIKKIEEGLKLFKINYECECEDNHERSKTFIIRLQGPLFNGVKNSLCKIILDLSFREKTFLIPEAKMLGRFLEEIPSFEVYVMKKEEIFAEKIRAIISRNKARDLYDLYFLLSIGVKCEQELIQKKLEYYKIIFTKKLFYEKLEEKKHTWDSELSPLMKNIPDFNEVLKKAKQINF